MGLPTIQKICSKRSGPRAGARCPRPMAPVPLETRGPRRTTTSLSRSFLWLLPISVRISDSVPHACLKNTDADAGDRLWSIRTGDLGPHSLGERVGGRSVGVDQVLATRPRASAKEGLFIARRAFLLQKGGGARKKAGFFRSFHCCSYLRCTYWEHD